MRHRAPSSVSLFVIATIIISIGAFSYAPSVHAAPSSQPQKQFLPAYRQVMGGTPGPAELSSVQPLLSTYKAYMAGYEQFAHNPGVFGIVGGVDQWIIPKTQ